MDYSSAAAAAEVDPILHQGPRQLGEIVQVHHWDCIEDYAASNLCSIAKDLHCILGVSVAHQYKAEDMHLRTSSGKEMCFVSCLAYISVE